MKIETQLQDLIDRGIFDKTELAYGLGILPLQFESKYGSNIDVIMKIEKSKVKQKAYLNGMLLDLLKNPKSYPEAALQFKTARYMLEAVHNQSEKSSYYQAKLKQERAKHTIDFAIRSAQLANTMDESSTLKLLSNIKRASVAMGEK